MSLQEEPADLRLLLPASDPACRGGGRSWGWGSEHTPTAPCGPPIRVGEGGGHHRNKQVCVWTSGSSDKYPEGNEVPGAEGLLRGSPAAPPTAAGEARPVLTQAGPSHHPPPAISAARPPAGGKGPVAPASQAPDLGRAGSTQHAQPPRPRPRTSRGCEGPHLIRTECTPPLERCFLFVYPNGAGRANPLYMLSVL